MTDDAMLAALRKLDVRSGSIPVLRLTGPPQPRDVERAQAFARALGAAAELAGVTLAPLFLVYDGEQLELVDLNGALDALPEHDLRDVLRHGDAILRRLLGPGPLPITQTPRAR